MIRMFFQKLIRHTVYGIRHAIRSGLRSTAYCIRNQGGQLLTEVLVAMAVGGILIIAATAAIVSVIRQNYESRSGQTAASVNYDILSKAKTYANSDWHNIYNLSHGTSSPYYIVSSATSSLSSGLIGYWKFDDGSGTTAADSSGGGYNGSFVGSPTWQTSVNCQINGCLNFSGSGQYINASFQTISANYTISGWVNMPSVSGGAPDYAGLIGGTVCNNTASIEFIIGNSTTNPKIGLGRCGDLSTLYSTGSFGLNQWTHIAVTVDASKNITYYINGVNAGVINGSAYNLSIVSPIIISDNALRNFTGKIDDVRIYNRALSVDEIKQLYDSPPNLGYSIAVSGQESVLSNDIEAGLVGYWKLDEGEGTTAFDYSGDGYIGTLVNSPTWTASSSCQVGGCLSFNGTNNDVMIADSPGLDIAGPLTLSAWVKWNTFKNYGVIAQKNNGGCSACLNYGLWSYDTWLYGTIANGINTNGASVTYAAAGINVGNWYLITFVADGSNNKLYVNGNLVSSVAQTITPAGNSYPLYISDPTYSINGSIDDVRVYNRALSANEISQLYNSSVYSRYFYVSNVNRDVNGNIASSGTDDPSTQQITAVTTRADGGVTQFGEYLTRSPNAIFTQSSWSGGSGQDGPITTPTNTYSTSTSIVLSGTSLSCTAGTSANLTSSIIDTQSPLGSAVNDIIWQGSVGGGSVSFQLAPSNSSAGPWSYIGPTGGGSYYTAGSNTSIPVTNVNNYRYLRYLIYLNCPAGQTAPIVNSVNLDWSP